MIKITNTQVFGWEAAIRGMRNPLNSWDKSDSFWVADDNFNESTKHYSYRYLIGTNDLGLMKRLRNAGPDHRKFMRMIVVYCDILAPLYWCKEFDTYKVGTVANSCSTMHTIHKKEFTLEDFSCEYLSSCETDRQREDGTVQHNHPAYKAFEYLVQYLNIARNNYNLCVERLKRKDLSDSERAHINRQKKRHWYSMIQLLPSSYNQKRTVMLNYEVLANMYKSRKDHKLDEWRKLCDWIRELPYSELITGED